MKNQEACVSSPKNTPITPNDDNKQEERTTEKKGKNSKYTPT